MDRSAAGMPRASSRQRNCASRGPASLVELSAEIGLPIRAGVHSGEAEVLADGDVAGVAIHFAARVMAQAGEGQIVVSSVVRDLSASGGLTFASIGSHELKGFEGAHELFVSSLGEVPARVINGHTRNPWNDWMREWSDARWAIWCAQDGRSQWSALEWLGFFMNDPEGRHTADAWTDWWKDIEV